MENTVYLEDFFKFLEENGIDTSVIKVVDCENTETKDIRKVVDCENTKTKDIRSD